MQDLISVIVPIYKVEAYLDKCVSSIVAQTHKSMEIILVDDGSPDNCGAMCEAWAEKDCRINVIHKQNGGISDARNVGTNIASGEYIAFVDSDDWIAPEMFERMLNALKAENADICACSIVSCFPNHRVAWGCQAYAVTDSEQTLAMLYSDTAYPVSVWNKLYRRELWDDLRFPVGKICDDAFTTYQLVHKANRIVQIPDELYFYRIRPNSIMTSHFSPKRMDEEEAWRCNYLFMEEHYPAVAKAALDFYLQKVNMLMHTIPTEQREEFRGEYTFLHEIMKKNLAYLLFASSLNIKQRIKMLLDYFK